jgi:hypothetical protein
VLERAQVETGRLGHRHRVVGGRPHLVVHEVAGELRGHAGPVVPEAHDVRGVGVDDRPGSFDRVGVTAAHDVQRAAFRTGLAAADAGVDEVHAAFAAAGHEEAHRGGGDRGVQQQHRAGFGPSQHAVGPVDRVDRLRVVARDHADDLGAGGGVGR